jgi:hypothetical protein
MQNKIFEDYQWETSAKIYIIDPLETRKLRILRIVGVLDFVHC